MEYPTLEKVKKGGQELICKWKKELSLPKNSDELEVMEAIDLWIQLYNFIPDVEQGKPWDRD